MRISEARQWMALIPILNNQKLSLQSIDLHYYPCRYPLQVPTEDLHPYILSINHSSLTMLYHNIFNFHTSCITKIKTKTTLNKIKQTSKFIITRISLFITISHNFMFWYYFELQFTLRTTRLANSNMIVTAISIYIQA